jgi:hypothetical protein
MVCCMHLACQGTLPGTAADPDVGVASRRPAAALSERPRSATEVPVTPCHVCPGAQNHCGQFCSRRSASWGRAGLIWHARAQALAGIRKAAGYGAPLPRGRGSGIVRDDCTPAQRTQAARLLDTLLLPARLLRAVACNRVPPTRPPATTSMCVRMVRISAALARSTARTRRTTGATPPEGRRPAAANHRGYDPDKQRANYPKTRCLRTSRLANWRTICALSSSSLHARNVAQASFRVLHCPHHALPFSVPERPAGCPSLRSRRRPTGKLSSLPSKTRKVAEYDPLADPNLRTFFASPTVQRQLYTVGMVSAAVAGGVWGEGGALSSALPHAL